MKAFHGDKAIKEKYLARLEVHRKADELIRGTGWNGHKGCAVGCTLEKYDHKSYETELGIPEVLAWLEDAIFEGLPLEKSMTWPTQFLEAIQVGADLSKVWHHFAVWLLIDPIDGVFKFNNHEAIRHVADLHALAASGSMPTAAAWAAARAAARAAAWAAARAAAGAAAWAAAVDAARAAAGDAAVDAAWAAAGDAAVDAAWAAAGGAARAAAYIKQSEKLLELLRAAK